MNNSEWLRSLEPAELKAWFESEHVEGQNATSDGARAALDGDSDSREKLEADVREFANVYYTSNLLVYDKVIELLDRQAAITELELCAKCEWPSLAAMPDQEAYDRIDELTAERDALADKFELARSKLGTCADLAGEIRNVAMGFGAALVDKDGNVL